MSKQKTKYISDDLEFYSYMPVEVLIEALSKYTAKDATISASGDSEYGISLTVNYSRPWTEYDTQEEERMKQRMQSYRRNEYERLKKEFEG